MKKILLIGDSIRRGYDYVVNEALENVAEVYYPEDNCRFAQYVLRHLKDWKEQLGLGDDVDLVHWNCGLWDTLELYEDGTLTPLPYYEHFIDRICRQMKILFPKAKFIFATSTPVLENNYPNPRIGTRHNAETRKFNKAAAEIVKKYGHTVNDLYSLMEGVPESYHSDMTHFYTPEGTKIISAKVISTIAECLEIPNSEINYELDINRKVAVVGL